MKRNLVKGYNARKNRHILLMLIRNKRRIIRKRELIFEMKLQKMLDIMDAVENWIEVADIDNSIKLMFLHFLRRFIGKISTFTYRDTVKNLFYFELKDLERKLDSLAGEISQKSPFFKALYSRLKLALDEFYREFDIEG